MDNRGIYIVEEDFFISYQDFFIIKNYIREFYVKKFNFEKDKKIYIQDNNYVIALSKALACLDENYEVVLGSLNIPDNTNFINYFYSFDLNLDLYDTLKNFTNNREQVKKYSLSDYLYSSIYFFTSGSTGEPKLIKKRICTLVLESLYLKKVLQFSDKETIYSFVPVNHIYGFIYSFVIPFYNNYNIFILPVQFLEKNKNIQDKGIFIYLPSLWSTLDNVLSHHPKLIITSGSQLGLSKESQFKQLKLKHISSTQLFEILGSTETGGFGYRNVEFSGVSEFNLFNKCRIMKKRNVWHLLSPYTVSPYKWYKLNDNLSLSNLKKFIYLGRNDRIIKYGQKRVSISSLEKNLSILLQREVVCLFKEDSTLLKGGIIEAYIEGDKIPTENIISLKQKYLVQFDSIFPNKFFFIRKFSKSILGKIQLSEIKK